MLLEIVVAVALLVLGMAVIGAQLQSASTTTYQTDHLARIVLLAETRMAELDSGMVLPNAQIDQETSAVEIEQDFGRLFPQYAGRVTLTPTATQDLIAVRLDILYDPERRILEHGEALSEFDYDDEKIVQTYHTLRTVPKPLNLRTDFGLEDDVAERINGQLQDSGVGQALDLENFDPSVFKDMSMEELVELLSILQQAFGTDQSALLQLVPESMRGQLAAIMRGLESGDGGEGTGDETGGGTGGTGGGSGTGGDGAGDGGGRRGGRDRGRGGARGQRGGDGQNPDGGRGGDAPSDGVDNGDAGGDVGRQPGDNTRNGNTRNGNTRNGNTRNGTRGGARRGGG